MNNHIFKPAGLGGQARGVRGLNFSRETLAPSYRAKNLRVQRKCACGGTPGPTGECDACRQKRLSRQREKGRVVAPTIVNEVLRSPGQSLGAAERATLEPRFGHDFARVRIHADARARDSARALNAVAYTVGPHIIFGSGLSEAGSRLRQRVLAHELAHTIQQEHSIASGQPVTLTDPDSPSEREADRVANAVDRGRNAGGIGKNSPLSVARFCTPASTCTPGAVIAGSAEDFGRAEEAVEAAPRSRRQRMSARRAVASGHGGSALQLEKFLNSEDPTRLANIQGIFIDADMSSGTGAITQNCADWAAASLPAGAPLPSRMAAATKNCTFVPGSLNREALTFNTGRATTIGGFSREEWRIETLQLLTHETEHPRFETATAAGPARPAGVTSPTCTHDNVLAEISEIAAGLSEFPAIFRPASAETSATGPLHRRMAGWFQDVAFRAGENFQGAMVKMGCSCECSEVDAHVKATFAEVTASNGWSAGEKDAFNNQMGQELPGPVRPFWPL